jgi:hypothetical protein
METPSRLALRILISSPGDVAVDDERERPANAMGPVDKTWKSRSARRKTVAVGRAGEAELPSRAEVELKLVLARRETSYFNSGSYVWCPRTVSPDRPERR